MYSNKISDYFKANAIGLGDIVRIERDGISEEGELMPSTEANSSDVVIIKLKSGYNIGVEFEGSKISLVRKGNSSISFPTADVKEEKGLPKVRLIYTGGTIGSKLDYRTGGVYMLLKPEELLYEVPELAGVADIEVKPLYSISSEDMSYHEWKGIAEEVAKAYNENAHGAVVTIGTDTMHYAAAALSFMLKDIGMPVVLTGAQRSSDRGSSDAFMNLYCSAVLAAKSDIAGVGICMHKSSSDDECGFMLGTRARKMHTSRRDAFRPVNSSYMAEVASDGSIRYGKMQYKKVQKGRRSFKPMTNFEPKVALLKAYPNSDPEIIDHYVEKKYKGIIIEGTGLGHTPVSTQHQGLSWLPNIKNAIDSGLIVGMTSQCLYGRVNPNVYRNLRLLSGAGVLYCEDMLPEVAYVKLGWLLGNYPENDARQMLTKNIAGEISDRSRYGEFLL
ncbi:Glu-tRNA(Gln) amidotransferase subunit GatD [Candidatus Marsarchaeota archaeon]|nr:Glu-tRNA(Gln) amidotransferase subunit GatD [Candidatus Marsarchaeota archaeon]MCL5404667.1 Glu-tRNA(Gln) amidotransferase subunit GatD [Candidatus Marsarchaeota archaeon]